MGTHRRVVERVPSAVRCLDECVVVARVQRDPGMHNHSVQLVLERAGATKLKVANVACLCNIREQRRSCLGRAHVRRQVQCVLECNHFVDFAAAHAVVRAITNSAHDMSLEVEPCEREAFQLYAQDLRCLMDGEPLVCRHILLASVITWIMQVL